MAEAPDVLFIPGNPRYRRLFKCEAWNLVWTRIAQ
jgi:hypothetical protein